MKRHALKRIFVYLMVAQLSVFYGPTQTNACFGVFQSFKTFAHQFSRTNQLHQLGQARLFTRRESAKAKTIAFFKATHAEVTFVGRKARKELLAIIETTDAALWDPEYAEEQYQKPLNEIRVVDAVFKIERIFTENAVKKRKMDYAPATLMVFKTLKILGAGTLLMFFWVGITQYPVYLGMGIFQTGQAESQRVSYSARAFAQGLDFNQRKLQILQLTDLEIDKVSDILKEQAILTNSKIDFLENDSRDRLTRLRTYIVALENTLIILKSTNHGVAIKQQITLLIETTLDHFDIITGPVGSVILDIIERLFSEYDPEGKIRANVYRSKLK